MVIMATLCYIVKDNKILMLLRNKKEKDYHKGKWNGLGGKFLLGESPEECAIREIKEESGLIVSKMKMQGFITFPKFDSENDWNVFVFKVTEYSGNLIDSPEGHLEWIEINKIFSLNLWEGDKLFLKWFLEDKFFSAKFIYENKQFKEHSVIFY